MLLSVCDCGDGDMVVTVYTKMTEGLYSYSKHLPHGRRVQTTGQKCNKFGKKIQNGGISWP